MPRKTKARSRLDKYYNLAKDQGYRSRAAFKLFQLNRKYNFLNNARTVVDLCAAPGGWMQVCASIMPSSSTIIGLDLIHIKPIPGCKAFTQDITTPQCVQLLKKEIPQKADVFLHDGAPNVGASWAKDAYNQNDLVLSALRLASQFLKKGGVFVTKVFRSTDYNSLMWVFNKFFTKVEATKPLASRFVSAEIFVVCLDYLAPEYIDEKLFDSKHVFKDTETDILQQQIQKEIVSVDKILQKRTQRHRSGYADDVHQTVYQMIDFEEFLHADNPYPIFIEYAGIKMTEETKQKYLNLTKPPQDYEILMEDIKVLGKREIIQLLKWRSKIKHYLSKQRREQKQQEQEDLQENAEFEDLDEAEEQEEDNEDDNQLNQEVEQQDDIDQLVNKQKEALEQQYIEEQKKELKEQRKQKQKQAQQEKKLAGKGIGFTPQEEDQELFQFSKHKNLLKLGYVDIEEKQEDKPKKEKLAFNNQKQLDQNLELIYENKKQKKENALERIRSKKQALESDQEEVDVDDLACKPIKKVKKQEDHLKLSDLKSKFFQKEEFSKLKEQLKTQKDEVFENPLKNQNITQLEKKKKDKTDKEKPIDKFKNDSDSEEQEEKTIDPKQLKHLQKQIQDDLNQLDDNKDYDLLKKVDKKELEYQRKLNAKITQEPLPGEDQKVKQFELNLPISDMEKRRRKLKKIAAREEKKIKLAQEKDPNHKELEIVPEKKLEDYDIDELATNLALAKKMMRKKTREQIIENSFGRDKWEDEDLPQWFMEDEERHVFKMEPITKEEFQQEKQRLYEINSRVPKKIMEAKIRKWKKAQKKLKTAAKKAQTVFDTDGINEKTKMQQVRRIYNKEKANIQKEQERKVIVARKGQASGKLKSSRKVLTVDKRLKKDKRAMKAKARIGKGKKRRHVSRRKGKKQKS
ncbi:unnamed protein product [Paramecium sonneborni]|uniref:Putative rRNA methyltransferase n=1 Tax=Paramecium sonneborni TaxID=65129 RepID=A0A8S1PKB8_9CILI|nr:unnamed protein product [Paramecium sonneborni]